MKISLLIVLHSFLFTESRLGLPDPDRRELNTNDTTKQVNEFLDSWHVAAAKADSSGFFGAMGDSSIYIGTDASERWTKNEFMRFAMPYFRKGKAWDFKPYDRDLHFSSDGKLVWFSELLNTWMGVCRGSGVLRRNGNEWEIEQYHLSVTVPNDVIQDFLSLIKKYESPEK